MSSRTSEELEALAEQALNDGDEEAVLPLLDAHLSKNPGDVLIWHWAALLRRSLDQHERAIADFEAALVHVRNHPGLTHALAHTLLEAGLPSSDRFLEAIRLAPGKSEIRMGLAAARFADGEGERGLEELGSLLGANAGWYDGHRKYAQLASMVGRADEALATIDRALKAFPNSIDLHLLGIEFLMDGNLHVEALHRIDLALLRFKDAEPLLWAKAATLDELRCPQEAAALFIRLGVPQTQAQAIRCIRHGLRSGDWKEAAAQVEPWLGREKLENIWPYAALAWRLTGDARWQWLEGRNDLTAVIGMDADALDIAASNTTLHALHNRSGRFLNQSVTHGTQTDGPLFARIDPTLTRLRETMRDAVATFVAGLPLDKSDHPTLRWPRDKRIRFAGSWSVRLGQNGFHSSHHHPQGWLSAVLYLGVPEMLKGQEGQLVLGGSPDDLGLPLAPLQTVAPKPGRLVIFPSMMWHGTLPFNDGERLTIAFDVARP